MLDSDSGRIGQNLSTTDQIDGIPWFQNPDGRTQEFKRRKSLWKGRINTNLPVLEDNPVAS